MLPKLVVIFDKMSYCDEILPSQSTMDALGNLEDISPKLEEDNLSWRMVKNYLLSNNIHVQGGEHEEEHCIYDENQNLVNDQDRVGMISMLHEVFMSQRVDVAKFLIRHKVDIDIADHGVMSIRKMAFISPAVSDMHSLIRKYDGSTQQSKSESKQCLFCGMYDDNVLNCSRCK